MNREERKKRLASMAIGSRRHWRGRLVWIPPTGDPFFVDRNPCQSMTTQELAAFRAEQDRRN